MYVCICPLWWNKRFIFISIIHTLYPVWNTVLQNPAHNCAGCWCVWVGHISERAYNKLRVPQTLEKLSLGLWNAPATCMAIMLVCEGGAERAVAFKLQWHGDSWGKLQYFSNWYFPLMNRGSICDAYFRSMLIYGSETGSISKKIAEQVQAYVRGMLRYNTG